MELEDQGHQTKGEPPGRPVSSVAASARNEQGAKLPAEELWGLRPEINPEVCRAYLSNICTAPSMRRKGVALSLIQSACIVARGAGVTDLYVHVADDNPGAHKLYSEVRMILRDYAQLRGQSSLAFRRPKGLEWTTGCRVPPGE